MKRLLPFLFMLLLAGCASTPLVPPLPEAARPVDIAQAQADPDGLRGRQVRWGGQILWVKNLPGATEIGVLRHGLLADGEPEPSGGELKRFVARIHGFLDPAEYRPGQRLTVVGRLAGLVHRKVGEYDYPYPLVQVTYYHKWGRYQPPPPTPAPPLFSPWGCGPFTPWNSFYSPYCW